MRENVEPQKAEDHERHELHEKRTDFIFVWFVFFVVNNLRGAAAKRRDAFASRGADFSTRIAESEISTALAKRYI